MVKYKFPDGFLWGAATASAQIEGAVFEDGKGSSIWDDFAQKPGKIVFGHTPQIACDHYHRYEEDLDLMKKFHLNSYRFSISWPRILPEGVGKINQKGLDFYDRLVDGLLERHIVPFVTLYHWDLPLTLEKKGGWRNFDTAKAFEEYTKVVVKKLGDRVKFWATFNELLCVIDLGYRIGYHAPGAKETEKVIRQISHNTLMAHGLGIMAIRENAKIKPIAGIVHNPVVPQPFFESDEDIAASKQYFIKNSSWMLEPMFKGSYPQSLWKELGKNVPDVKKNDMEIINQPLDYLGFNVYSATNMIHHKYGEKTMENYAPSTDMKWAIVEDCVYWGCRFIHEVYNPKSIYVTENGCAYPDDINEDGRIYDFSRIEYLRGHLKGVHRAVSEKIPIKGYFCWSLMDNFEWAYGYTKRFGLTFVNFENQKRIPKLSLEWYSNLIKNNGF